MGLPRLKNTSIRRQIALDFGLGSPNGWRCSKGQGSFSFRVLVGTSIILTKIYMSTYSKYMFGVRVLSEFNLRFFFSNISVCFSIPTLYPNLVNWG
jgi:hypothetical protein